MFTSMTNSKSPELFNAFFNTVVKMRKILDTAIITPLDQKTATVLQFQVLQQINDHPKITVGTLSQYLNLSYSSTSQLIDKLAERSLLNREHDLADRRTVKLTLTKQGKASFEETLNQLQNKINQIFALLPEADMKQVVNIFNNFLAKYEKISAPKAEEV